jgi:hypothetical protein
MTKTYSSRTHVFASAFDQVCLPFGSGTEGLRNVSKVVGRNIKTVRDWRSGREPCPRWAYELVRLTHDERLRTFEEMTGRYRSDRKAVFATRLSSSLSMSYGLKAANDSFRLLEFADAEIGNI